LVWTDIVVILSPTSLQFFNCKFVLLESFLDIGLCFDWQNCCLGGTEYHYGDVLRGSMPLPFFASLLFTVVLSINLLIPCL